mgnify:CR=1 FL=1
MAIIFIPLLTLCLFSVWITQRYIKEEVNKNNQVLLQQASQNIDMIINDLNSLSLNFGVNPYTIIQLDHIFGEPKLAYQDMKVLNIIKSYIDSSAYAKPHLHSIYLYYRKGEERLVSSADEGLVQLNTYYDREWLEYFLSNRANKNIYSELRTIRKYSFEPGQDVLSLFKNLFMTSFSLADGVIIMNVRTDYLLRMLENAAGTPDEGFIVVNERGQPLIFHNLPVNLRSEEVEAFLQRSEHHFTFTAQSNRYAVTKVHSGNSGWTYLTITPHDSLYVVPRRLILISILLLAFALMLGLVLAFYVSRSNYLSFLKIMKMLDAAKEGRPLPTAEPGTKDEHSVIIENLVKVFIKQEYFKMQLSERKYRMKALELMALQSQINPHFLYNTLHTISWKAIALTKKPNEVSVMIENLSTILKYALSNSAQSVILDEEIFYTMCYVNIQSVRYRNKFRVIWKYDEDLSRVRVIKLMLQPLIENSIYHGIKEKEGSGTIVIRIARVDRLLKFWVIDDGVGMDAATLRKVKETLGSEKGTVDEHIGLYNVNKRLILTYGEEYGLKIRSKPGVGTAIYFKIPIH